MPQNRFLIAAVAAADRGWHVFPVTAGEKIPCVRNWEQRATTDRRQLCRWWSGSSRKNVGIAVGKSGLVVVDLDPARGEDPPPEWAGARHGHDVLARLAARAGQPFPGDTYTVASPSVIRGRRPEFFSVHSGGGRLVPASSHHGYLGVFFCRIRRCRREAAGRASRSCWAVS